MMKKFTLRKSLVIVLAFFCMVAAAIVMIAQQLTAKAADSDPDTVTVKSLSVQWDPDPSHNQDWFFLELDGANFTTNNEVISETNWDWFSPFIYVNGVALSENAGFVMYGMKGYPNSAKCVIFIQRGKDYSLKNDGTDVIEIKAGCKIPKSGDETAGEVDYYLVSEDAAFASTSSGNFTGEEAFTAGSPVTVDGISVEWDGNGGAQDYIMIRLNGAAFPLDTHSLSHWEYFAPYVYVNGEAVTNKVAWATEGMYGDSRQFCFFIAQDTLRQDGTDTIEVRKGCRIPLNDGASCYYVTETATFAASDNIATGTTAKFYRSLEIGKTYDADESVFAESNAGETIGEFTSLPILPGYIDNYGITKWADYSNGVFAAGNFGRFKLLKGTDVETIKSVSLTILYPAADLFYIYPLNATSLVYENAKQSFRTTGGLQTITLSTELLAVDGQFEGFILQMIDGTGAQFFVDDVTPLAEPFTPDTVEKIESFEWETDKKYDADGTIFGVSVEGETIGEFTSLAVVSENLTALGLEQYGTYTGNFTNESYAKFQLQNAMDVATVKSVSLTIFRNTADLFYVYPLNASALGVDSAVQSFCTTGGFTAQTITLSTELLAVEGQFSGFILQMASGEVGQQLFVDDVTPLAEPFTPEPDEPGSVWEIGRTYDADNTVFAESNAGETIGEFTSLRMLPFDFDTSIPGLTQWADYSTTDFEKGQFGKVKLQNAMDVEAIKSVSLMVMHNKEACFYIYPLNATSLVYENAKQSFRTTGGLQTITLSTELLAVDGQFEGFILQMVDGEGTNFFLDDMTPKAETYTPDTVEKIESFEWETDKKYDADGTIFGVSVEGETIGEFTSLAVVSENLTVLGLEQYGTYTGNFTNESYAKFQLQNAMDVATVKSVSLTIFRNTADLFYVYPLNTSALGVDSAVQSFRTTGGFTAQTIMLSTELLAVEGQFGGFILQMASGEVGQQLFVDDVTPLAEPFTPEPDEPDFVWEIGKTYDADNTVFAESAADETIGEFTSLRMLPFDFDTSIPGLTQWADYSTTDFEKGQFGKVKLQNAMDVEAIKSVSLMVMHNKAACFYVYPLNATSLVYENAMQSFRVNGQTTVTLSTELLAVDGKFEGFILQMVDGEGTNFFLDDMTPKAETYTPAPVEPIVEFEWETDKKYDADGTIFDASAEDEKIGEFTSLAVYRENLNAYGLTEWATYTGNFTNGNYAKFKLQTAMDVATVKSVSFTIMRNTADLFYVYPLNASALGVDSAVQSFRTTGGLQTITLSTELLAVDGQFEGFILQMIDGVGGQQFFVDDVTPKAEVYNPDDVEQLPMITAQSFIISQDGDNYKIFFRFNKCGKFNGDEILETSKVYINGRSIDDINAGGNFATAEWDTIDGNYQIVVVLSKSYTGVGAIKNADNEFVCNSMTVAAGLEFPNGDSIDRTYTCHIYKDERLLDYELIKEYEPVKVVGVTSETLPNATDNISFKIRFDKKIATKGYYHASQTEAWRELNLIVFQDMYDKEVSAAFVAGGFKSALFDCVYINGVSLGELTMTDSWVTAVFVNYGQTDAYTLDISFDSKSETYSVIRALIENGEGVTVEIKSGLKFTTGCMVMEDQTFKIVQYTATEDKPLQDFKVYYGGKAIENGAVVVTDKQPSESNISVEGVNDYEITSTAVDGKIRFTITFADGREFVFDVDYQPVEVEEPEQGRFSGCFSSVGTEALWTLALLSIGALVIWRKRYE